MADFALIAQERALSGKGAARKLRAQGFVPAIIYGDTEQNLTLAVPQKAMGKALASGASLIDLTVEGESKVRPVIVKEVQKDPVSNELTHIDFLQVSLTQPITTTVPVVLINEDHRGNDGGIIEHSLREIEVTCLPTSIPDYIEVDVSGLKLHESVHVASLVLPQGVEMSTNPDEVVVSIVAPAKGVEEEEETAEEAQE